MNVFLMPGTIIKLYTYLVTLSTTLCKKVLQGFLPLQSGLRVQTSSQLIPVKQLIVSEGRGLGQ